MRTAKNTIQCRFKVVEEGIKYAARIYYLIARIQRSKVDKINQLGNWNNQVVKHAENSLPRPSPRLKVRGNRKTPTKPIANISQKTRQTINMLIVVKIL